jgi:two-component system, NarL family, sensor kinase
MRRERGARPEAAGRATVVMQVGRFALAGLVALGVVGLATTIASRRIGEREAIADARATTVARAEGRVTNALTDGILVGDPDAVRALAAVVEQGVLDDSLVRVKVWNRDGTIVYSDEPRLAGTTYALGPDELDALLSGAIDAEVSDLTKPENRYERDFGRLLEVYLPIYTPSGEPLLFEAYFRYDAVSATGSQLFRAFAPITLGALVLLQLVQLPLAWSLARRLRQRVNERALLLQRAIDASEVERRQIAADLHDGVVQDLAGVAYALSGAARRVGDGDGTADGGGSTADLLETSAEHVRGSITALRSLLVDIYPPNLEREGLASAMADLAAGVGARGLPVTVDTAGLDGPVPPIVARLLYRAAQESLRNVVRHAEASSVQMLVGVDGDRARLEVRDDGRGFDPEEAAVRAAQGHVGLRSLSGLVEDAGGTMQVRADAAGGTRVEVEVPVR